MRTRFGIAAGVVTFSILVAGPVMAAGKSYTAADVAKHRTTASCWTIIGSSVYDITSFIPQHPGGKGAVTSLCGKNGTAAFNGQHGGARTPKATLSRYRIGALEASAAGAAASSSGAGVSGAITAGQVATHDRASDCWTSIDGRVYNLTSFVTPSRGQRAHHLAVRDGRHRSIRRAACGEWGGDACPGGLSDWWHGFSRSPQRLDWPNGHRR